MKTAAIAAAIALIALEGALRIGGYSAPRWHELDAELGWRLKAHRHGWHVAEGSFTRVNTNPAGFRDREHHLDKPEGVYRIAVLGDDYSEALNVDAEHTYWALAGRKMQACGARPGTRVELLNFGVAGYGSAQEHVLLERTVMRYQPDLVLVQFANRDDLLDNSYALARDKARPFFRLDAKGVARIDDSFASEPAFERRMQTRYRLGAEIADHSRAFQVARQLAGLAAIGSAHAADSHEVLAPPRDALWEDAWRITEAVISKMDDFTRRNGARLVLVAVPHPRQSGMAYPDRRLAALGERIGMPVITLAQAVRPSMYLASGEWTAEAHAAAAALIAHSLCAERGQAKRGQDPFSFSYAPREKGS